MPRFIPSSAILIALLSTLIIIFNPAALSYLKQLTSLISPKTTSSFTTTTPTIASQSPMLKSASNMSKSVLRQAKITPHRSGTRGHSDHGWLNTYHSFSFADWYDPRFSHFGSLRVLNEDRVKANSGFPTHPHRDFEIFSYILSGELTHRDSMLAKGSEGAQSDKFYRMHRGDVQFTTGGTGIAHSEFNEHAKDTVHFLQIWATPWRKGLAPRYHTRTFDEAAKREGFITILSPLKGGPDATAQQEKDAEPEVAGSIPIHADFAMGAGIITPERTFEWVVGAKATEANKRKVYVHLPMTQNGKAKIRIDGREDAELVEGDGAFVEGVHAGDKLAIESIGSADAEVIVLDTA
ncbi:RmlC-like jelly roll fold protein [Cordyceps fumosorosea ARSEF 2679]|uniref:RmlC-like jelly roll fold protein n=1 Tax=Cordyceps fumosorosea (strain ARSEF 2679) TaxID=1081104 RepID=A0A167SXU7_CORFA|nr:RmlC-like jelly roll fold protein [Cordyceps fumosorosea ARSEF 2679]OAA60042.1 RmlC-like jelly roll fold protein [Cordyceps fumosorosea ARSEF 2679]